MLAAVRDRRGMKKKYTNSDNDAELVSAARRGDRDAFAHLVVKYQDRIFNAMFRMTGSRDDAADLAQEAFLKALNNLPKFDGRSRFSTWLWSVALNLCTSKLRRRKVERASGVRIGADSSPDGKRAAYDPPDGAAGPVRRAHRAEMGAAIENAILSLDEQCREVVVLRDMEKMEYGEIARTLGVPEGTVKSRLHRARKELRIKLDKFV